MNDEAAGVVPQRLAAGVCWVEAASVLLFGALVARASVQGAASDSSAAYTQVAIAILVAAALAALGTALVRGRRWPIGVFVTTQILVGVISLSQIGAAFSGGSDQVVTVSVLLGALACAAAGLWSASALASARHGRPPGAAGSDRG